MTHGAAAGVVGRNPAFAERTMRIRRERADGGFGPQRVDDRIY